MKTLTFFAAVTILLTTIIFFIQDTQKDYHCTKLAVLVGSLYEGLAQSKTVRIRQRLLNNAMPVLFSEKIKFLAPFGYWPTIFNGYTQAATVANLNANYLESAELLLKAIHYHPFLANAFEGLSRILIKTGFAHDALYCSRYSQAVLKGAEISNSDRQKCIETVEKLLKGV